MNVKLIICALAALLSIAISLSIDAVPIEQKFVEIHAEETLNDFPEIEDETIELKAALADLSHDPLLMLRAEAALLRYPNMLREILPIYGASPEFQDIFKEYGEVVLPAIHYFVSYPISSIEWMDKASKRYKSLKAWFNDGQSHQYATETDVKQLLTPEERGWYAIRYIQSEGFDFIGQFVVAPNGNVEWIVTERVVEGFAQFFTSGIRQLETKTKLDEEIEASDIGWASLDILVFASAVKVLRVGRSVAVTTQATSRGTRSAALTSRMISGGRLVLNSTRYAKWPAILGGTYLVFKHPSLINDFFVEFAGVIGVHPLILQFTGWFIIIACCLFFVRWILWFLSPLINSCLWALSLVIAKISGRKALENNR